MRYRPVVLEILFAEIKLLDKRNSGRSIELIMKDFLKREIGN
jgi:hypothetical protein